jgi:hypothetical protein
MNKIYELSRIGWDEMVRCKKTDDRDLCDGNVEGTRKNCLEESECPGNERNWAWMKRQGVSRESSGIRSSCVQQHKETGHKMWGINTLPSLRQWKNSGRLRR